MFIITKVFNPQNSLNLKCATDTCEFSKFIGQIYLSKDGKITVFFSKFLHKSLIGNQEDYTFKKFEVSYQNF